MAAILMGFPGPGKSLDEAVEVLWGDGTRLWRRFWPSSEKETSDSVPVLAATNGNASCNNQSEREEQKWREKNERNENNEK
jgi:hypothetical protein